MNYIKKKIKGHKKGHLDDDDDIYDPAFIPPKRGPDGAPQGWVPYEERIDEDSEEWLAYKKLTQRVTDTLQKTQDNLTKIVAASAVPEGTLEIKTAEEDFAHFEAEEGSAARSWINFDDNDTSSLDDSSVTGSLTGTPAKSAGGRPPARPPPPGTPKHDAPARPPQPPKQSGDLGDFFSLGGTQPVVSSVARPRPSHQNGFVKDAFGLGDNPTNKLCKLPPRVSDHSNVVDSLDSFLLDDDDKCGPPVDGDDPFDTSFVEGVSAKGGEGVSVVIKDIPKPSVITEIPKAFPTLISEFDTKQQKVPVELGFFDINPEKPEEQDNEDPFTYPEDLGVAKQETNNKVAEDESGRPTDKMNLSYTPYRAKSPNPFLVDDADAGLSSMNPFASDLLSSAKKPPARPPPPAGGTSSNPFAAAAVAASEPQDDMMDFFGGVASTVVPVSTASNPTSSQILDLFSTDFDSDPPPTSLNDAFNVFNQSDGVELPKPKAGLDFFDHLGSPVTDSVTSASELKADLTMDFFQTSDQQQACNNSGFDFFSTTVAQQETVADLMGGIIDDGFTGSRKSSDARSIASSGGDDLFLSKEVPLTAENEFVDATNIKHAENDDSIFAARQTSIGSDGSMKGRRMSYDVTAGRKMSGELLGRRRSSVATAPALEPLSFGHQSSTKPNAFDVFDSVHEPMNAFDGLAPVSAPKPRIEIPVELRLNADVLEALGQKGPKTPVVPLEGFDLPTPLPGGEFDNFSLGSSGIPLSMNTEVTPTEVSITSPITEVRVEAVSSVSVIIEEPSREVSTSDLEEDDAKIHSEEEISNVPDAHSDSPDTISQSGVRSALDQDAFDAFDAFEARFESATVVPIEGGDIFDPFGSTSAAASSVGGGAMTHGFGGMDEFDPFMTLTEPPAPPQPSPAVAAKAPAPPKPDEDSDSDDSGPDFSVFIRPKMRDMTDTAEPVTLGPPPVLAPPPKSPARSPGHTASSPRFNPFDKSAQEGFGQAFEFGVFDEPVLEPVPVQEVMEPKKEIQRTESQESAGTPLFDEDDSQPLEEFPTKYADNGWELVLRQPNKKKLTGQRFWKKVFVRIHEHVLHLFNSKEDKDPFQELPLQACYSVSEIAAQQFDNYGKVFTVKLQYIFYKERVGVRPGQISKVAHGQITSFGQLAKLGLPLEHAPQVSQLLKLGTQNCADIKVFAREVEDALFRLPVHRDRALTYKTEEIQVTVQDETFADVSMTGHVNKQLARVRVFFLAFISGMPDLEVGLNDIKKKGLEVVGRHDIIPVVTEEWIRLEDVEFHSSVLTHHFDKSRTIKLHPPDACFFELCRFRIRPPRNRELPLQVRATITVGGNKVEIRCNVLVPGYSSRKHGQIPCEDVAIRFPIPECWIYLFRVEKHFRYGSKKSAPRKPGKIKGLERIMGAATTLDPSLIEVSTGLAKYEHQHRAVVWRVPRLPKEGQGAYTEHSFVCRLELTSYDQMPEELAHFADVEFTMPATTVSHTTVRSISVTNPNPPEKHVRYISRHEYRIEIEHVQGFAQNVYVAAAAVSPAPSSPAANKDAVPSSPAAASTASSSSQ